MATSRKVAVPKSGLASKMKIQAGPSGKMHKFGAVKPQKPGRSAQQSVAVAATPRNEPRLPPRKCRRRRAGRFAPVLPDRLSPGEPWYSVRPAAVLKDAPSVRRAIGIQMPAGKSKFDSAVGINVSYGETLARPTSRTSRRGQAQAGKTPGFLKLGKKVSPKEGEARQLDSSRGRSDRATPTRSHEAARGRNQQMGDCRRGDDPVAEVRHRFAVRADGPRDAPGSQDAAPWQEVQAAVLPQGQAWSRMVAITASKPRKSSPTRRAVIDLAQVEPDASPTTPRRRRLT